MSVLIVTSLGDIVIDLHADRCPLTSKNFIKLCKMKYYNGCLFHKVEKDFMAQTGDCTGTGMGGDSLYKFMYGDQARFFEDEIHPDLKHSKTGTVAMASAGENCNASQFYFTLRDEIDYLDGKHTVFGIVEENEGLDTLAKINETFVDDKGRPFKDIRIKHTYVLDDPFEDPPQLADFIPEKSPEGKPHDEIAEERLEDNWVPMDETLSVPELQEVIHAKEAHTNAAILESIGDIPDADIKPPENVLFVCKLNPVTQDEDLYTIFSRFGNVIAADIIRDYKTGDSLCYAFIEFETNEACERAYFKDRNDDNYAYCENCLSRQTMDNTLIDDRRIHVDFSQSVSKLWKQFRHGKRSQTNTGGCFKCGAVDHIARDCEQAGNGKQSGPKYVLKHENTQHGDDHRRYDMMFDEENLENMEHEGNTEKRKSDIGNSDHSRHRDYDPKGSEMRSRKDGEYHTGKANEERKGAGRNKDTGNLKRYEDNEHHKWHERSEGSREDEMNRECKRDDDHHNGKANNERGAGRYKDTGHHKRYEENKHHKRHERGSSKDHDGGDHINMDSSHHERDHRKRSWDNDRSRREHARSERSRDHDNGWSKREHARLQRSRGEDSDRSRREDAGSVRSRDQDNDRSRREDAKSEKSGDRRDNDRSHGDDARSGRSRDRDESPRRGKRQRR